MIMRAFVVGLLVGALLALKPTPLFAQALGGCVYESPTPSSPQPGPISPECNVQRALNVNVVGGGGTGGGAAGTPGSAGSTAQYVQGVSGGYPIAVTGTFSSTTTFPYSSSTAGQTATAASFLGETCVYTTSAITLTSGQVIPCLTDVNGNLLVHINYALPPGTNTIGAVNAGSGFPGVATSATSPPSGTNIAYVQGTAAAGNLPTNICPVGTGACAQVTTVGVSIPTSTQQGLLTISQLMGLNGSTLYPAAISTSGVLSVTTPAPYATNTASQLVVTQASPFVVNTAAPVTSVTANAGTGTFNVALGATPQPVAITTGAGLSSAAPFYVYSINGGSGGGGITAFPYAAASAAPTSASFLGASGFDGTYVRPLAIDPTTGYLLTKSGASVNGTYGAPNTTVTASATSVQYEQGTQANGYFGVNLGATPQPVSGTVTIANPTAFPTPIAYTSAAPIPATIVNQPTSYVLGAGAATIGSIGNAAFGITGAASSTAGAQSATGVPAITTGCIYNSATPAPTTGQFVPLQCSSSGGLLVSGTFTASTSFPYSLLTQGQTATNASGVGVLGVYNSTALSLTTGQAAPLQLDSNGYLAVDVKVGGSSGGSSTFPYSTVPFPTATQTPAANTALGISCPVATPTSAPTGGVIPITCSPTNGGINLGSITASVSQPYSLTTQGQTALAASGVGVLGVYNSTAPTLTTGQAAPLQLASNGSVNVTQTNAIAPYSYTYSQTAITASFVGIAGYSGSNVNPAYVDTNGIQRHATCSSTVNLCAGVGSGGTAYVTVGGSATVALTASATAQVVKSSAGRLVKLLVTTAGTSGATTCYDNASAASGTVIAVVPSAAAAGTIYDLQMPAANGITCSTGATGNALTASYY